MEESGKKKVRSNTEASIFTVPFSLEEVNATKISPNKLSKTEIFSKASKYHLKGKIKEAIKYYQYFLDRGYVDSRVISNYGVICQESGQIEKAIKLYQQAIKIDPSKADAYSNLGTILYESGKYKEAEIIIKKAIKYDPKLTIAYVNLGLVLIEVERLEEAQLYLSKAIEINSKTADAYNLQGIILNSQGEPDKAEHEFRKALNLKPNLPDALYNIGTTLINIRKKEEGKNYLKQLIAIEHYSISESRKIKLENIKIKAKKKLAHCLFHEGDFESTLKILPKISEDYYYSYKLGCLLGLNKLEDLYKEYKIISEKNICNPLIGSIVDHSNIISDKKINSTFCNEAIEYIFHKNLNESEFPSKICDSLISLIHKDNNHERVRNGINDISKTKGNIFSLQYSYIKELRVLIEQIISNYRSKFHSSEEGFIRNWPENYHLGGWLINTKSGGLLKPHMHEGAWLSGSIYLKVPKFKINNQGSIVFNPKGPLYPDREKLFPERFVNVISRDLCIFPSSLFHYTIPFEGDEERICFVFDISPI